MRLIESWRRTINSQPQRNFLEELPPPLTEQTNLLSTETPVGKAGVLDAFLAYISQENMRNETSAHMPPLSKRANVFQGQPLSVERPMIFEQVSTEDGIRYKPRHFIQIPFTIDEGMTFFYRATTINVFWGHPAGTDSPLLYGEIHDHADLARTGVLDTDEAILRATKLMGRFPGNRGRRVSDAEQFADESLTPGEQSDKAPGKALLLAPKNASKTATENVAFFMGFDRNGNLHVIYGRNDRETVSMELFTPDQLLTPGSREVAFERINQKISKEVREKFKK